MKWIYQYNNIMSENLKNDLLSKIESESDEIL